MDKQTMEKLSQSSFHAENARRRARYTAIFVILIAAVFIILVLNINTGNVHISVGRILKILFARAGDKDEINIMKYIGATDFFVRAPFVVEGILIGIIGSLIPLTIVYFVYTRAITYVASKFTMLSSLLNFLPVEVIYKQLIPISLAIGIGIGFFGSFTTVRKHLHV